MARRVLGRSNREPGSRNRIPIYDDVSYGSGGIAGGKFTFNNTETELVYIQNSGTAQSATASTITLAAAASSTDDAYNNMSIQITGGTGSGQNHQRITDYNGTSKEATLSGSWTTNPDSTSTYRVVNRAY